MSVEIEFWIIGDEQAQGRTWTQSPKDSVM